MFIGLIKITILLSSGFFLLKLFAIKGTHNGIYDHITVCLCLAKNSFKLSISFKYIVFCHICICTFANTVKILDWLLEVLEIKCLYIK